MSDTLRTQIITALDELISEPVARPPLPDSWLNDAVVARKALATGKASTPTVQAFVTKVLDRHNIVGHIYNLDHPVNEAIDDRCATCKHPVIFQQPAAGVPFYSHVLIDPFEESALMTSPSTQPDAKATLDRVKELLSGYTPWYVNPRRDEANSAYERVLATSSDEEAAHDAYNAIRADEASVTETLVESILQVIKEMEQSDGTQDS